MFFLFFPFSSNVESMQIKPAVFHEPNSVSFFFSELRHPWHCLNQVFHYRITIKYPLIKSSHHPIFLAINPIVRKYCLDMPLSFDRSNCLIDLTQPISAEYRSAQLMQPLQLLCYRILSIQVDRNPIPSNRPGPPLQIIKSNTFLPIITTNSFCVYEFTAQTLYVPSNLATHLSLSRSFSAVFVFRYNFSLKHGNSRE